MSDDLEKRIEAARADPRNMGEMTGADAIGTVGNADCGDMLRVWVKFKEENGRRVIDRASFQSFGCETAIAAASLAMELIRGKTPEDALKMRGEEFARDLGPLPPTKVHCTQLVEGAIRSALAPEEQIDSAPGTTATELNKATGSPEAPSAGGHLNESFSPPPRPGGMRLVFLDPAKTSPPPQEPPEPPDQQQQQQQ
jgi:NifU-like protein involved in Fe-S cluster formation